MKDELKSHVRAGRFSEALDVIVRVPADSPVEMLEYAENQVRKIPTALLHERVTTHKRLAILGGATTHFLTPLIRLCALQRGVLLETYESEFGLFEQEIWAESPTLREFRPDVIHFHVSSQNLGLAPYVSDPARVVRDQTTRFLELYRAACDRFGCAVIANNFETSIDRVLGGLDAVEAGSRNNVIRAINDQLSRNLPPRVYVNDVEQLSSVIGKQIWFDPKLWNETKTAVSFACQPNYADRLSASLAAMFGQSKKCLVLDLDNTLWGGVIGDDGLHGIKLGQGQPEGEAFFNFQTYVKALKERGVLLAIASKNELENALQPFREHAESVLKPEDFACVVANWEPKDRSLRHIAQKLNIGLDSLVFFDDNPAERQLVASMLPVVTVIDVPRDPSLYVQALDSRNLFDAVSMTLEDTLRSDFMQKNQSRDDLQESALNYDDFLRRLEMSAVVEPIGAANAARVAQLVNKTNQFNLTTLRMTETQVQALIGSTSHYTSTIRLNDKFGATGLISVVIGTRDGEVLHIDNWLMSCRVLKRGVELLELQRLLEYGGLRGLREIVGTYKPTEKNKLVKDHYADLGFEQIAADGEGTSWRYVLNPKRPIPIHHIALHEGNP